MKSSYLPLALLVSTVITF